MAHNQLKYSWQSLTDKESDKVNREGVNISVGSSQKGSKVVTNTDK
jgi:hypothetical protein